MIYPKYFHRAALVTYIGIHLPSLCLAQQEEVQRKEVDAHYSFENIVTCMQDEESLSNSSAIQVDYVYALEMNRNETAVASMDLLAVERALLDALAPVLIYCNDAHTEPGFDDDFITDDFIANDKFSDIVALDSSPNDETKEEICIPTEEKYSCKLISGSMTIYLQEDSTRRNDMISLFYFRTRNILSSHDFIASLPNYDDNNSLPTIRHAYFVSSEGVGYEYYGNDDINYQYGVLANSKTEERGEERGGGYHHEEKLVDNEPIEQNFEQEGELLHPSKMGKGKTATFVSTGSISFFLVIFFAWNRHKKNRPRKEFSLSSPRSSCEETDEPKTCTSDESADSIWGRTFGFGTSKRKDVKSPLADVEKSDSPPDEDDSSAEGSIDDIYGFQSPDDEWSPPTSHWEKFKEDKTLKKINEEDQDDDDIPISLPQSKSDDIDV